MGVFLGGHKKRPGVPIIAWASEEDDLTPDFNINLPRQVLANDVLVMQYRALPGGTFAQYFSYTVTAGDIIDDTITIPGGNALAEDDYEFRARLERGALVSAWSSILTIALVSEGDTGDPPTMQFDDAVNSGLIAVLADDPF